MPEELDLQKINAQDLGKEEVLKQVREEVEQHKLTQAVDLIYKFLQQLKGKLAELGEDQEDVKNKYHTLVLELEWLGFSMLGEAEVKGLIKTDLLRVLRWVEYDLQDHVSTYLLAKVPILFRDRIKKEFIAELKQNQQKVSSKEIEDQNEKKISPTMVNWLKEYDLLVGSGLVDKLKKTEFLYQSKNSRELTETERGKLVKLIDFYEFLKRTSEHPEGVEEKFIIQDEDRLVEIDHGKVVELGPIPEVAVKEEDPAVIHIRHPHIEEFLEDHDKIDTHLSAEKKEEKVKFVKPKVVAPTFKEAEAKMKNPKAKIQRPKPQPKVQIPEPIEMPAVVKPVADKSKPKPQPIKPMPPINPPKKVISDIKAPQKVLSLTDELEQISVDEFRNLGANKIREKMGLLENESMEKRAEGIEAWKKSPVNLLYLEIGQESVMQGRGVREVIQARESSEQPTLTYAEFEDLADLNKSLRF